MSADTAVVVDNIKKSIKLWRNIVLWSVACFLVLIVILSCTKTIFTGWGCTLGIPLGPLFVGLSCLNSDIEGLCSFKSKYDLQVAVSPAGYLAAPILGLIGLSFLIVCLCFHHWAAGTVTFLVFCWAASGTLPDDDTSDGGPCDSDAC